MTFGVGGPDFPQMEPTDQLDAADRRLPEGRVRQFANRRSAFGPSLFLITNSEISITFSTRPSCPLLALEARFWELAGTISGTVPAGSEEARRGQIRDYGSGTR